MITVLADDFSGAAEIAGIAWRYGLQTVLQTEIDLSVNHDIIVIDTDTRSKKENETRKIHQSLAHILKRSKIDWFYKKTDSVLRGHIVAELESLAIESGMKKIMVAANNPSTGRVIRNNHYYIDNRKLHETHFRFDPEFPLKSSVVTEILGSSDHFPITYLNRKRTIAGAGIFVPEIINADDLSQRASEVSENVLPAGGSDFFRSLLEAKGYSLQTIPQLKKQPLNQNRFYVLVSTSDLSRKFRLDCQKSGVPVCNLPCTTLNTSELSGDCLKRWVSDIKTSFNKSRYVVGTVMHPLNKEAGFIKALNQFISQMVKEVLERIELNELIVEGGTTTSHLVRYLGWRNFMPVREYSTGVVELHIEEYSGCTLTVKPGSYPWPEYFIPVDIP